MKRFKKKKSRRDFFKIFFLCLNFSAFSSNILDNALMAATQFGGSSVLHGVMAQQYSQSCSSKNYSACIMAAITLKQSISDFGKQKSSLKTAQTLLPSGFKFDNNSTSICSQSKETQSICKTNGLSSEEVLNKNKSILSNGKIKENFKKTLGATLDPDTGNLIKDGKEIDLAQMGKEKAMNTLGVGAGVRGQVESELKAMDQNIAQQLKEKIKNSQKEIDGIQKEISSLSSSGMTIGSSSSGINNSYNFEKEEDYRNRLDQSDEQNKDIDSLENKGRSIGKNESVGLSVDNIFNMVDRRYQKLSKGFSFID